MTESAFSATPTHWHEKRNASISCRCINLRRCHWESCTRAPAGILYTREGAKQALEFFKHYSASFNYHLVRSCLDKGVPICGVYPNIMGITNSSSGQSTIDTSEVPRVRFSEDGRESLTQLLRRRLATWHYSIGKLRMRRLLRKVIRIGE